ncbi:MAG: patatin-like phospholipase RssA [Gammaproteobacteria bacterium]|nr:patatin-like phospholipase RssA [Gammaproteobacteria bacterium]
MSLKVGLALGSGAARGWAHIGVIEGLLDLGINIDAIAGCSIGAYVGASYCNGSIDELREWVLSLTEWQVIKLMGVSIPKGGLVTGEKVFTKLKERFVAENIEQLKVPFSAVATDMRRGQEVVFTRGSTVDAVRASCSIPGLFSAHRYQNRWLLDGAVVNPVPVSLCKQLGVDVVIAVNLGSSFNRTDRETERHNELQKKNDDNFNQFFKKGLASVSQWFGSSPEALQNADLQSPPSIFNSMSNAIDIMQDRLVRGRLASDPPDVLLDPNLDHIGTMEFHRAEEAIRIGRETVQRMSEEIKYQLDMN